MWKAAMMLYVIAAITQCKVCELAKTWLKQNRFPIPYYLVTRPLYPHKILV